MSTGNLFQNCTWEEQYESDPLQFPRPATDEIISVYEVYIKEEIIGTDGKSNVSFSDLPGGNDSQSIQGSQVNLDAILESEIIGSEEVYRSLLEKNGFRLKLSDESLKGKENVVIYSQPISDRLTPGVPHHVDKNDPRSRLHFVKYLKRDGKTLKIWECGICSKEFRHQYTLMRHLPTHTDERNFKCDTCGKAFRQLSTLSQHKAIHSDARPYICEFCKKTFNRVSTLISHRKTHSENKPHKCHLCGKGFHQKGNLRNHVFTHTNERPYKCEICGKGFNQMSNLVCHKVKAHAHVENMRYSCTICGKEFPRRSSLRSHEEVKHGIKYRQSNNAQIGDDESNSIKKKNVRVVLDNDEASTSENNKEVVTTIIAPSSETIEITDEDNSGSTFTDMNAMNFDQNKISELATIIQPADDDDELRFLVEPRHLENSQGNLLGSLDSQFFTPDRLESDRGGYLEMSANDECKELLELAAHGGIQFVHATEDETDEVGTVDAPSFHGFSDSFIFGAENQIMVLNSSDVSQKINMSDDVQVLDNKEIRILGRKQPDEPQLPDMTFLSQPIDFACPKNSDFLDNNELDYVCENS